MSPQYNLTGPSGCDSNLWQHLHETDRKLSNKTSIGIQENHLLRPILVLVLRTFHITQAEHSSGYNYMSTIVVLFKKKKKRQVTAKTNS